MSVFKTADLLTGNTNLEERVRKLEREVRELRREIRKKYKLPPSKNTQTKTTELLHLLTYKYIRSLTNMEN